MLPQRDQMKEQYKKLTNVVDAHNTKPENVQPVEIDRSRSLSIKHFRWWKNNLRE